MARDWACSGSHGVLIKAPVICGRVTVSVVVSARRHFSRVRIPGSNPGRMRRFVRSGVATGRENRWTVTATERTKNLTIPEVRKTLKSMLQYASREAAVACSRVGCRSTLPYRVRWIIEDN